MNLYLRDKEKYQEGVLAERALANQELQAERERANRELQAERERADQRLNNTLQSIASKFHISVEELLDQQPHNNTPKA